MALQLDWDSFWAMYESNPEMLQHEVDNLPDFLRGKPARVQIQIVKHAPHSVIINDKPHKVRDKLMSSLCYDAQIQLLQ